MNLVPREKSDTMFWVVDRMPYFISQHDDGDELWKSHRPYAVNEHVHKFPQGFTPTLDDVDAALADRT